MRLIKVLLALFFIGILSNGLKAQSPAPKGYPITNSYGWIKYGWVQSDSGTIMALRDTLWTPRFAGTKIYWRHAGVDSSEWIFNGKTTGQRWVKQGTGSGTSGVSSITQGYGLILTPNPITTTGSVKLDSATVYGKARDIVKDSLLTISLQRVTDIGDSTTNPIYIKNDGVLRNSNYVYSSGYPSASAVLDSFSNNTTLYMISTAQNSRVRQNGYIEKVEFSVDNIPANVTHVYFDVWRKRTPAQIAGNYDTIAHVEVTSLLTAGQLNVITLPYRVLSNVGDFVGISYTASGSHRAFLKAISLLSPAAFYKTSTPSFTNMDWAAETSYNFYTDVRVYMQAPNIVFIGNSIIEGLPNRTEISNNIYDSNAITIPYKVATNQGVSYQNMGVGGQTTGNILSRFRNDVVLAYPSMAIIEGGVNDVAGGASRATIVANVKAIFDTCVANNIIPLYLKILPWTIGTNAQNTIVDAVNNSLDSLALLYPTARIVDARQAVGQFRVGGAAGNLWDIKTVANLDGTHFSDSGMTLIANRVIEVIDSVNDVYAKYQGGGISKGSTLWTFPSTSGQLALVSQIPPANTDFWKLTGNSGTNPATNFLGNTDNVGMKVKIGGIPSGEVSASSGLRNTGWGWGNFYSLTSGFDNSLYGYGAGVSLGGGAINNYNGIFSGYLASTTNYAAAFGGYTLYNSTSATNAAAFGYSAGRYSNTSYRMFFNTIDRTTAAKDTTDSPMFIDNDATPANQRVKINANVQITQLPSGASTDSVVTVDNNGTLKKLNVTSVVPTQHLVTHRGVRITTNVAGDSIWIDDYVKVATSASASTITPNVDTTNMYTVTALATAPTFAAPTGTPYDGQSLVIRIKDNGTARALTFNSIYRASTDFALPTTTVISKTMYLQFIYNDADTKWDCIGLTQGF